MKYFALTLAFILAAGSSQNAQAGPFGFDTKSLINPADKYSYCSSYDDDNLLVYCSNAPRPHPYIGSYVIAFIDDIGMCSIIGMTESEITWPQIKLKTDNLAKLVKRKYGEWNDKIDKFPNRDHSNLIKEGESTYGYIWGFDRVINGIESIYILTVSSQISGTLETFSTGMSYSTPLAGKCGEYLDDSF